MIKKFLYLIMILGISFSRSIAGTENIDKLDESKKKSTTKSIDIVDNLKTKYSPQIELEVDSKSNTAHSKSKMWVCVDSDFVPSKTPQTDNFKMIDKIINDIEEENKSLYSLDMSIELADSGREGFNYVCCPPWLARGCAFMCGVPTLGMSVLVYYSILKCCPTRHCAELNRLEERKKMIKARRREKIHRVQDLMRDTYNQTGQIHPRWVEYPNPHQPDLHWDDPDG